MIKPHDHDRGDDGSNSKNVHTSIRSKSARAGVANGLLFINKAMRNQPMSRNERTGELRLSIIRMCHWWDELGKEGNPKSLLSSKQSVSSLEKDRG